MSYELHRIEEDLGRLVKLFADLLRFLFKTPSHMAITQIVITESGDTMSSPTPVILGITLGNVGTFQEVVTAPAGAAFPAGTTFTWSSSDPLTTLTPSSDTTQVAVATSATDTATSFVLTCTSSFTPPGASAPLSATATVPLNAATPPPPVTPTSMAINQLS